MMQKNAVKILALAADCVAKIAGVSVAAGSLLAAHHLYTFSVKKFRRVCCDDHFEDEEEEKTVVLEIAVPFHHTHHFLGPHRERLNALEVATNTRFELFHANDKEDKTQWLISGEILNVLSAEAQVMNFLRSLPQVSEGKLVFDTPTFLTIYPALFQMNWFRGVHGQLTFHVCVVSLWRGNSVTILRLWSSRENVDAAMDAILEVIAKR
ncbi:unnamed protein product [Notodromas monacha]|uniref:Uncharacterized protein n=1 Tax=Notodromas monacha TaxID=399045 RepID=A0A7R9G895_9CRUS|nr:unnamed protein product [Notodromas monacha]CAG0912908.1 unnamed protein product [Notodromas monacha]